MASEVPDLSLDQLRRELRAEIRASAAETRRHTDTAAEETRGYVDAAWAETRRHFDVVAEGLRSEMRLMAEGLSTLDQKVERFREEVREEFRKWTAALEHP